MTRNNLSSHLSWLLRSRSNVPTSPPVVPLSASSTVALGSEPYSLSQFPSQIVRESGFSENTDSGTHGDCHRRDEEFAHPSLPASVHKPQGSETMGRLQLGSKSSTKPRLLSSVLPEVAQTPKQPSLFRPATSLGDQYNAAYSGGNPSK